MPVVTVTKTYNDGDPLTEDDLDGIKTSVETALNVTKLDSDNIQDASLDSDTIAAGAIIAAKIASDAVTTAKILNANVTTDKIADDAVTTAKILNANVTTAKIADLAVTTGKLADVSVTTAKIATSITLTTLATTNLTFAARTPLVGGSSVPEVVLAGRCSSANAIQGGITWNPAAKTGTGQFNITYTAAMAAVYGASAVVIAAGGTMYDVVISALSTTGMSVVIRDNAGTLTDADWTFIVYGSR